MKVEIEVDTNQLAYAKRVLTKVRPDHDWTDSATCTLLARMGTGGILMVEADNRLPDLALDDVGFAAWAEDLAAGMFKFKDKSSINEDGEINLSVTMTRSTEPPKH